MHSKHSQMSTEHATEKDIRESVLEAGLVRKWGMCLQCKKDRFVIAKR